MKIDMEPTVSANLRHLQNIRGGGGGNMTLLYSEMEKERERERDGKAEKEWQVGGKRAAGAGGG